MKYIISVLALSASSFCFAADDSNFSLGLGNDHGGIGAKYSINTNDSKYYASLGIRVHSSEDGTGIGYGVGWDRKIGGDNHSLGIFGGAVSAHIANGEVAIYHGLSGTYNYYFSGFNNSSFVLGGSIYSGVTSKNENIFEESSSGVSIKVAYQW
ncbi:hypothetical protein [Colwellia piezophila]|uniref:hypothetical protein n=1 Tax=Colwellia piezophila TaxID=211668 RepID=UPI00036A2A39|nr:hypothetical protein [Colwellia piezophila]